MNETPTRNKAKSGDVINWVSLSPFQLYLDLIANLLQSPSCHIAIVSYHKITELKKYKQNVYYEASTYEHLSFENL